MLHEIHLPELKTIAENGNIATFAVEPLFPGYGMTLGNSLRRVILSSLPGAAIVAVKIEGVSHEFSTIKGIKEDVVEMILNLKNVCVKSHSEDVVVLKLSAKGEGVVKASAFEKNADVEVVNPNQVIATLDNKDSKLELEVFIETGRGYVPVEKRDGNKFGIGVIAIDALYSPIRRVRYNVESTRVGQMTDLDKLIIEVETNGVITPDDAVKQASEILVNHFKVLCGQTVCADNEVEVVAGSNEGADILIEEINLSPRTTNALLNNDIKTVADILKLEDGELKTLKGFGSKAYDEVRDKLVELGFEGSAE